MSQRATCKIGRGIRKGIQEWVAHLETKITFGTGQIFVRSRAVHHGITTIAPVEVIEGESLASTTALRSPAPAMSPDPKTAQIFDPDSAGLFQSANESAWRNHLSANEISRFQNQNYVAFSFDLHNVILINTISV